ncbi:MAG: biotin--[acetyl-CoA-carboxylase] ligase [Gemmatimonadetes bacterium GWC2_71_10]|nr:MAG: biotin--[acetyl-CoA-carboxylase] ligase [Gemmatimonadetes bacterium GWC2_71_10]
MRYDGLTEAELARLVGVPLLRLHDTVGSTLDIAHELGGTGAPHGSLVLAEAQSAGRGRQGRRWLSPPGGLWLALLLRPRVAPTGGALAVRAGLAARAALAAAAPEARAALKWPNDLIVDGRKVGGVLCEASWNGARLMWIAVGVGINVRGPVAPEVVATALALDDVAPGVTRVAVLEALVPLLRAAGEGASALTEEERAEFLAVCWRGGADDPVALEPDGALLVRRADGGTERRVAPD